MEDLPDLEYHHSFDKHGNYLHTHEIQANLHKIESKYDLNH